MCSVYSKNQGFSLVELMIVVAIIGILSAVAIPNFQKMVRKSKQTEAKMHLSGIYLAEKAFHAEWNMFFASLREIGYIPSGAVRYNAGFSALHGGNADTLVAQGYHKPKANIDVVSFDLQTVCPVAAGGPCQNKIIFPDLWWSSMNTALGVNSAFLAGATANIGGSLPDQWLMDHNKTFRLMSDGTY